MTDSASGKIDKNAVRQNKKKKGGIAPFLILLLVLAALSGVLAFNVFGLRDRYIYPIVSKAPIIGELIPEPAAAPEDFSAMSGEQMTRRINELEAELFQAQQDLNTANVSIVKNKAEIVRLKEFESQQAQFKQEKLEFDQRVAMGDPSAFTDYYESMYPENAEILYPHAATESSRLSDIKMYMGRISEMDEVSASNALQQMIPTDLDLVVAIMKEMDSRAAGAILSEMNAQSAASVIKRLSPFKTQSIVAAEVVGNAAELP